jgi:hypothetical protein
LIFGSREVPAVLGTFRVRRNTEDKTFNFG